MAKINPILLRKAVIDLIKPDENNPFRKIQSMTSGTLIPDFALKCEMLLNPELKKDDIISNYQFKLTDTSLSNIQGVAPDDSINLVVFRTRTNLEILGDAIKYPNAMGNDLWVLFIPDEFFTDDMLLITKFETIYTEIDRIIHSYNNTDLRLTTMALYYKNLSLYIAISAFSKHYNVPYEIVAEVVKRETDIKFTPKMYSNIVEYSLSADEDILNMAIIVALFTSFEEDND